MIKANELRIGNWVSLYLNHSDVAEFQIDLADLNLIATDKKRNYNPIPLTEDWLLKFGFEQVKSDYEDAETWDFNFGILYFDMANNAVKINGQYCLSNIPEYLHKLQNLYFALTGEELEMKGGCNE